MLPVHNRSRIFPPERERDSKTEGLYVLATSEGRREGVVPGPGQKMNQNRSRKLVELALRKGTAGQTSNESIRGRSQVLSIIIGYSDHEKRN